MMHFMILLKMINHFDENFIQAEKVYGGADNQIPFISLHFKMKLRYYHFEHYYKTVIIEIKNRIAQHQLSNLFQAKRAVL